MSLFGVLPVYYNKNSIAPSKKFGLLHYKTTLFAWGAPSFRIIAILVHLPRAARN
jgi:hypothetical protein